MKKPQIKSFRRFMKEEKEMYYTLDLPQDLNKEEVTFLMNQLLSLIFKMRKNTDVRVVAEPVLETDED